VEIENKILEEFYKNKEMYLSGEDIARALGVSRQAFWKHVEKLRRMGYIIEAVPHLGYKLMSIPNTMVVPEIKRNLRTHLFGKNIVYHQRIDSTNDAAYSLAEAGAPEGTVVVAESQQKGKGRMGRKWVSPAGGGIYFSCIIRPDISPAEVSRITLVAALSVVKAIKNFTHLDAALRWPNDVLIKDKKVTGILTELKAEADKTSFVVLGIGVNVNTETGDLPEGATSLKAECKKKIPRAEFFSRLLEMLEKEYNRLKKEGFKNIRKELKIHSCTLGRYVRLATSGKKRVHGHALDIDENGALVLKMSNGEEKTFFSGDVTLVR